MNEKEVERIMGYLNSKDPYYSFKETVMSKVFVDKSMLLKEVLERINTNVNIFASHVRAVSERQSMPAC